MSDKVLSQTANAIRKREARARAAGIMTLAIEPLVAAVEVPEIAEVPEIVAVPDAVIEAAINEVARGETFTFVGYAVDVKGRGAVRYTNDKRRTRTLVRAGCTDIKFVELPQPMTKAEIDASEFIAQVMPAAQEQTA